MFGSKPKKELGLPFNIELMMINPAWPTGELGLITVSVKWMGFLLMLKIFASNFTHVYFFISGSTEH